MRKKMTILVVLLAVVSSAAAPHLVDGFRLDWWCAGPSYATLTQGDFVLQGIAGQTSAGQVSQADLALCSGFLCRVSQWFSALFLPLVMK